MAFTTQFKKAWNAFRSADKKVLEETYTVGPGASYAPQRQRISYYNERSIVSSIYTRIGIDVAGVGVRHVKLDEYGRYLEDMATALNQCLTLEPNIDQGPRQLRQDIATSLFDKGVAAIVPVDTAADPAINGRFDIYSLRVGEIVDWYPRHVKVRLYNEAKGIREDILLEKSFVAIVENPLYAVMNEPNSTLQRLTRKLQLLDAIDTKIEPYKVIGITKEDYFTSTEAQRKEFDSKTGMEIKFQKEKIKMAQEISKIGKDASKNLLDMINKADEINKRHEVVSQFIDDKAKVLSLSRHKTEENVQVGDVFKDQEKIEDMRKLVYGK